MASAAVVGVVACQCGAVECLLDTGDQPRKRLTVELEGRGEVREQRAGWMSARGQRVQFMNGGAICGQDEESRVSLVHQFKCRGHLR